jgi:hypothetical protein
MSLDIIEKGLKEVRWLYLGFFIVLIIFTRVTIPTTARPTQMTIDYYNYLTKIKAGDVVVILAPLSGIWASAMEMNRWSTYKYLEQVGACVVWGLESATQPYGLLWVRQTYNIPTDIPINKDPRYGTLFVVCGPGLVATTSGVYLTAVDFRSSTRGYDIFGTSFDNLPGIKNVKTGADIALAITSTLGVDMAVAFGQQGVPVIATGDNGGLCVAATNYGSGLMKGVLLGSKGGMEMDTMLGYTGANAGPAASAAVALAAESVYLFSAVIFFNIAQLLSVRIKHRFLAIR